MIGIPYYNETIKQAVTVFGSLFNNIVIRRKDGRIVPVAIAYGPRDKWMEAHKVMDASEEMFEKMLPRMSYEVVAMNYDIVRKLTNKQQVMGENYGPGQVIQRIAAPVPYNLDFSLYIQTKNLNDGWQIIEQILPFFTPSYTVRVRHYPQDYDSDTPLMENEYDIPFVLNAVTWSDDFTGDYGDRRVVEWTLEFNTKVWMYGPTAKDLSNSNVNLHSGKVILDARAIVAPVPDATNMETLIGRPDSDTYGPADEVGYAHVDSRPALYTNDSEWSPELSPNIINTIDSDGVIVKVVRNINNF